MQKIGPFRYSRKWSYWLFVYKDMVYNQLKNCVSLGMHLMTVEITSPLNIFHFVLSVIPT
jgi:hypothetical protein